MRIIGLLALATMLLLYPLSAHAQFLELFAKGSVSKNNTSDSEYQTTVSGSAGIAFTVIPRVRLEARYTNNTSVQNQLVVPVSGGSVTLNNIMTETSILSAGIDVDLLGDKYWVQPFIYVGAGYVTTSRSYYYFIDPTAQPNFVQEPKRNDLSGSLGAGIRVHIARAVALEFEVFAYGIDFQNPNPLTNAYGTAGLRIFL